MARGRAADSVHAARPRLPLTRPAAIAVLLVFAVACGGAGYPSSPAPPEAALAGRPTVVAPPPTTAGAGGATAAASTTVPVVVVPYRVERRTSDAATADFEAAVQATLADGRGWSRAGFRMVPTAGAEYRVVLAEGPEVDRLCAPYVTRSTYSCQLGPVVALNADRWRTATPQWTGDLASYRVMLVNHEFGHLLGQKHPDVQCPGRGQLAPVMAQQSTELGVCLPNPWPLDSEIDRAARHDLPLAPPYER